MGWCFALHVTDSIMSLDSWIDLFRGKEALIKNEYGEIITSDDMVAIIKKRKGAKQKYPNQFYKSDSEFHYRNQSMLGPNNLVRSEIDGAHCIGHGDGTWDLISGEFS